MALKLLTLLALFAACGIVHAEKNDYCLTICSQYQDPTARNVVRGQKHRASRSKGHLTRANQRAVSLADFCSAYCQDGGISTRQFGSIFPTFQNPFEYFTGGSGSGSGSSGSGSGSSGSGLDNSYSSDLQGALDYFTGGSDIGSGLFGSGSGSSGSSTGSSGGGLDFPQTSSFLNPFGFGSSSQSSSTGESGTSASGSDGSSTSGSSSGSSEGSTGGSSSGK